MEAQAAQGARWGGAGTPHESARVRTVEAYTGAKAASLLRMTPYWWTASPEQQKASSDEELVVTVDVLIGTFLGQARADAQSAGAARARARRSHKRAAMARTFRSAEVAVEE